MHLDLSWVFSIFKVPKLSRAVSGSDARNFRLRRNCFGHIWRACYSDRNARYRRDTNFSIPDSKLVLSTSASIVKAGLNEVWKSRPSQAEPRSQVSSVPLQKENEKPYPKASQHTLIPQPTIIAPIFTHLPFPQTGQREEPYISADPQHPFQYRFFSLPDSEQRLQSIVQPPKLKTSRRAFSPVLQLATVLRNRIVSFGSSAAKGIESSAGHWQYPFYFSPFHFTLFDSLPDTDTVSSSPSKSLLFQNPDQDHIVPCSPLSPLSIPLSFPPAAVPPPPELIIKIASPEGYSNADHHKSQITHFLSSRANDVANSLIVIWQLSRIDSGGRRGLMSLKTLFAQLDEKVLDSDRTALSRFSKISITIPNQVKDVALYYDLPQQSVEDDIIDLTNAVDLHEFTWHGDFVIFASKFRNLSESFVTLTTLNIKSSNISIENAITLLHSCPALQTVSLGTIQSEEDSDAIMSLKSSGVERKALPNLTHLALESDVALHPLIRRFCWTAQVSLNLTLRKQGTASFVQALNSGSQ